MNINNKSISDVATEIIASPAPVLIIDTCALLDIIRLPYRTESAKTVNETLQHASFLVSQSKRGKPNLWIVIPPLVAKEWDEHHQSTIIELRQNISNLDNKIKIIHTVANFLNLSLGHPISFSDQGFDTALAKLSSDFLDNTLALSQDNTCMLRATNRTIECLPPGRKGGEIKDCIIVEHTLELCSKLRISGFSEKCVFLTSNTKDYCNPRSSIPKSPLDLDLNKVKLVLTTKWGWAKKELGL